MGTSCRLGPESFLPTRTPRLNPLTDGVAVNAHDTGNLDTLEPFPEEHYSLLATLHEGVRTDSSGITNIHKEGWQNRLTAIHPRDMVIHMKTTLNISDVTMLEVKREAARRRQTMSELVEAALRAIMEPEQREVDLPPLPEFGGGGLRVNVANRDALYNVMEG